MSTETQETPYQVGLRNGTWTAEQVRECGWTSAQACLENEEKCYQEEVAGLADLYQHNPEYAKRHAAYMEGIITAARVSLRDLMDE